MFSDKRNFYYLFKISRLGGAFLLMREQLWEKTVPCAISVRVDPMTYFGSLNHKKKKYEF
jgi:hypothetical protein